MKNIKGILILCATVMAVIGCDKDFEDINTNPYALLNIDPALLFAGAQQTDQMDRGGWETEHTIVQHFVNPHNSGATLGPNFNADIDNFNNGKWDNSYPTVVKNMVHALYLLEDQPERVNLRSMLRIWKAQVFMGIVDNYADVPYFDAGLGFLGEEYFYPSYDDDELIYADLEKELREAVAAMNPGADYVSADLFYGDNGTVPSGGSTAQQVEKWKKLGNSLLLRLGMRYSKINPSKAGAIVSDAYSGGVMTSNADNAYLTFDGTAYTNDSNDGLVNNNPYFYYAAEPFVEQLKATSDPRAKYLIASFENPADPLADASPNTDLNDLFGVPVGVINTDLVNPPYRGTKGGGYDYAQFNVNITASLRAPAFYVTYGEVSLLLAEAAQRGWIAGSAQDFYEEGIRADMDRYSLYPNTSTIPSAEVDAFIASPGVAYNAASAMNLINTQLWIAYIRDGIQAFANFRRSGFPDLEPNMYNNLLNGGFVRRLSYPDYELAQNRDNYLAAVTAIGGTDNLVTRVFWDSE